ncbi:DNA polymerase III subunit chi [Thalassotalea sp. PS06]|uniref:DNA polymerase III subunit chi n=1 Tax=Thalassotalea sp. PS06 TaxID=2594005 RepID=UPI00116287E7|nr:DNA polymerase III subunit chi [Thalassotalea sp. PS06]QDP02204.1 DNA polymerase III subunit chi [Thalassotalea sp. PS06]
MTLQAIFYLLGHASEQELLRFVCAQATLAFRQNKRVFIYTEDQDEAHQIDELLWSSDAQSFVPHNLPGEAGNQGSPVEISWLAPTSSRQVLINLASEVPDFAPQYSQIIDFVIEQEEQKQQARQRYRRYQQAGFHVETRPASKVA